MKRILVITLIGLSLCLINCGDGGACEGAYGSGAGKEECFDGWDESECADWDEQGVNGSSWVYHSGSTCEDLGFTTSCGNNTWVKGSCP